MARVRLSPTPPALSESSKTGDLTGLEVVDHLGAAPGRTLPWRNRVGTPQVIQARLDEGQALDELAEHQNRLALGGDHVDQLFQRGQLARPPGQRTRLVQVLGRVVADLLEDGQEPQHQPLPGDAVLALDRPARASRTSAS